MRIVDIAMDACRDNRSKVNVFNERFINVHLAFLICLARGMMFEKSWIFQRSKKSSYFSRNKSRFANFYIYGSS